MIVGIFVVVSNVLRGGGRAHSCTDYIIPLDVVIRKKFEKTFDELVTIETIYKAWDDFVCGKRKREDVNVFAVHVTDTLFSIYNDILSGQYKHGAYDEYSICDPKKRVIHKASVRDRVVHRLLYNTLYPYFDIRFIYDSYSCRFDKGTHKARDRFRYFVNIVSQNYTKQCYVLKFDIKKCFESVDQGILKKIIKRYIVDEKLVRLLFQVINSFPKGLPLGNLTSQVCINIYLHELDIYCKHILGCKQYIRYADDVVIVEHSKEILEVVYQNIFDFVTRELKLILHKKQIQSIYAGVDVLGEVFFSHYKRLRRSTERRQKLREKSKIQ